jgi:hypothetical protein
VLHAVTQGEEGGDEKFGITKVGVEVIRRKRNEQSHTTTAT